MDMPKLPDKVPMWVPLVVAGVGVGAFILLKKGGGTPGSSISVIQVPLPGSGSDTEGGNEDIPIPPILPIPPNKPPKDDPGEPPKAPEPGLNDIVKAWADAQDQLKGSYPGWGWAGWDDIWKEILRNPTLFVGDNPIRKLFQAISAGLTGKLNELQDAYESAKTQLGKQQSSWYQASLRSIVQELKKHPELMQGQKARELLVNLPL